MLFACSVASGVSSAQEKPLVTYEEPLASYLQRIQAGKREFAFRSDWPGGLKAWQTKAREALARQCGLKRIAQDLSNHKPVVRLEKPTQVDGTYSRIRGSIETEPGVQIPFYILVPKGDGPFPLALCPHGHDASGWRSYAGAYTDEVHRKKTLDKDGNVAEQLVLRGFIAIATATRGLATETAVVDVKGRHGKRDCRAQLMHCLLSGRTPIAERVWDLQKTLDWAVNQPKVDKTRIVMLGNSGGGVATAYAAAMDTRIKVAIPSCSFTSIASETGFIFHCDCCAIPAMFDWGDLSDVGGLIAPRPLLIVHGIKDGLHHRPDVERNAARVRKIYKAAGAADAFVVRWGESGHRFYPAIMWPFVDQHFGLNDK